MTSKHPTPGGFLRFWRETLITGGKLALLLGGLVTLVLGGSALAYVKAANHKVTWVIAGAVVVILLLMIAAYLRWQELHAEATDLRSERDRAEIGPKHHARLETSLSSFAAAVERNDSCDFSEEDDSGAVKAHFPDLVSALEDWNAAITAECTAPEPLHHMIREEVRDRDLPEPFLDRIADRLVQLTVGLNGATDKQLTLNCFSDGPPGQAYDRTTVMLGHDTLLVIDGTSAEDANRFKLIVIHKKIILHNPN